MREALVLDPVEIGIPKYRLSAAADETGAADKIIGI
jgi:hypothetical protein